MRLIVIGTSSRAQIKLNSQYVSGYHAEIIQLDNGDMFIVDKNSVNGTFVNGQKVEAEKEVPISRGANVMIADTPLDWSLVPQLVVDRNAKALVGIGTHYRNKIRIAGDRASRFHATLKQTKDGKWWICDHSTNGTMVNGSRITRDRFVQLKRGDKIICAGQEVDNPIKGLPVGKIIGVICGSVAAAAAVVGIILYLINGLNKTDSQLYSTYKNTLVYIKVGFLYHVSCPSMEQLEPNKLASLLSDVDFTLQDGKLQPLNNYSRIRQDKPQPMQSTATGFFISKDGLIATNLHVAKPWLYGEAEYNVTAIEMLIGQVLHEMGSEWAIYQKDLKVEGVMDFMEVIPDGRFNVEKNALPCVVYAASPNKDVDVSIIRLQQQTGELPAGCKYVDLNRIKEVENGDHIFTMGYPLGESMQEKNEVLQALSAGGDIMKVDKYSFTHNATTKGGASGSPIFNRKGNLVGIHHAHLAGAEEFRYGVKANYIKWLLEKERENKF